MYSLTLSQTHDSLSSMHTHTYTYTLSHAPSHTHPGVLLTVQQHTRSYYAHSYIHALIHTHTQSHMHSLTRHNSHSHSRPHPPPPAISPGSRHQVGCSFILWRRCSRWCVLLTRTYRWDIDSASASLILSLIQYISTISPFPPPPPPPYSHFRSSWILSSALSPPWNCATFCTRYSGKDEAGCGYY